ncbi:hypothetical protein [Vibrio barjaei]|nr:hypothetical protein [Vibrio barjaei]MCY9874010.1 hypothetical protein [Vibrio barjaei]
MIFVYLVPILGMMLVASLVLSFVMAGLLFWDSCVEAKRDYPPQSRYYPD